MFYTVLLKLKIASDRLSEANFASVKVPTISWKNDSTSKIEASREKRKSSPRVLRPAMTNKYIEASYPWPYNGNLAPKNTCLIVIDMQVDFCSKGGACFRFAHRSTQLDSIYNVIDQAHSLSSSIL